MGFSLASGGGKFNLVECNAATETCCASFLAGGNYSYACIAQGMPCIGLPIACAHTADCQAGSVCCYRTVANIGSVACVAPSDCQNGGVLLCEPNVAGDCAPGHACIPFANSVPYSLCQ